MTAAQTFDNDLQGVEEMLQGNFPSHVAAEFNRVRSELLRQGQDSLRPSVERNCGDDSGGAFNE